MLQDPLITELFSSIKTQKLSEVLCILFLEWIKKDPPTLRARQLALLQTYSETQSEFRLDLSFHLQKEQSSTQDILHLVHVLDQNQRQNVLNLYLWSIALADLLCVNCFTVDIFEEQSSLRSLQSQHNHKPILWLKSILQQCSIQFLTDDWNSFTVQNPQQRLLLCESNLSMQYFYSIPSLGIRFQYLRDLLYKIIFKS
jgi:hypothetical protein